MAEGGYDPTTENETPWEDHGIDHDDDDDDDDDDNDDTTGPGTPGASSTPNPYHGGEEHEMTRMDQEEEGLGDTTPLLLEDTDFRKRKAFLDKVKQFLKRKFPRADFNQIAVGIGSKKNNEGRPVAVGSRWGETRIFKKDGDVTGPFFKTVQRRSGPSAEKIIAEDQMSLRDTQQRVKEAQQEEARWDENVAKHQQAAKKRQQLEIELEQINQRRDDREKEGGTRMEIQIDTDKLNREIAKLKRDIKAAKEEEKRYAPAVKERDKAAREVARLRRQAAAQKQKKDTTEAALNRTKTTQRVGGRQRNAQTQNRGRQAHQR